MKRVDLHIHSNRSDGILSPSELAARLVGSGLECVALTDHNVVHGIAELRDALRGSEVQIVDGVEMSVEDQEVGEIHMLGYGIDTEAAPLRQLLAYLVARKRVQISRMIERLQEEGRNVNPLDVLGSDATRYVGRQALARALVEKKMVGTIGEAFARYLGRKGRAYMPMGAIAPEEGVAAIHQAGGLAVLAHPSVGLLDACLTRLVKAGMDGIEVYRRTGGGNEELYAELVAEDFGLCATGGSDWHGEAGDGDLGEFWVRDEKLIGFFERPEVR